MAPAQDSVPSLPVLPPLKSRPSNFQSRPPSPASRARTRKTQCQVLWWDVNSPAVASTRAEQGTRKRHRSCESGKACVCARVWGAHTRPTGIMLWASIRAAPAPCESSCLHTTSLMAHTALVIAQVRAGSRDDPGARMQRDKGESWQQQELIWFLFQHLPEASWLAL